MSKLTKVKKKRKNEESPGKNDMEEPPQKRILLSPEQVTEESVVKMTGLSSHVLGIVVDMCDKSATLTTLTIIDILCQNPSGIRAMNKEEIAKFTPLFLKKKSLSTAVKQPTDDVIRKFILEEYEQALEKKKVLIGGTTNQYEKLSATERDRMMLHEFVGYAQTNQNYSVYVYYTGPSDKGLNNIELKDPRNWTIIHKSHLLHFHKRFKGVTEQFLKHTKYDQKAFDVKDAYPLYDPRFMVLKWLGTKEGKQFKPIILENRHLFRSNSDFLINHYEKTATTALHYFDFSKDADMEIEKKVFNVEEDYQRQRENGFRLTEEDLCHVTIEEYPNLSRIPITKELTFTLEDFVNIGKRLYAGKKLALPPDHFKHDPLISVKAVLFALNSEAFIKRTASLVCDEHTLVLECDNIVPILEYIFNNKACAESIKEATSQLIYATLATELVSRVQPEEIGKKIKQSSFSLLTH